MGNDDRADVIGDRPTSTIDRRRLLWIALVAAWPRGGGAQTAAAPDPLAALDAAPRSVVAQYLKGKSRPGEGDAAPDRVLLVDLDGDGAVEAVVQWTFYGPTFAQSFVSVFAGRDPVRLADETRLTGLVEQVRIEGRQIRVDAKTLGPGDARCCPTKAIVERFRWAAGRLRKG